MSPLIDKLRRRDHLSDEETRVLTDLLQPPRRLLAGEDVAPEGSSPQESTLLLEGFCARYSTLRDGGRQITELNVPGDFVDLHSLLLKPLDHGVMALTDVVVAGAPHETLRRITEGHPHLTRLLWLDTLIDAAIHRQWLRTMGRQDGLAQFSHLLAELYVRLEIVGRARDHVLTLPLTQTTLADALGLSVVHVNRLAQEMRRSGLVAWRGSEVRILDWDRLCRTAEFDATYLRLEPASV